MKTVTVDPEIMWGTPVFAGSKVPIQTLLDYIETGETVNTFLSEFPSVKRDVVIAFLEQGAEKLIAPERQAILSESAGVNSPRTCADLAFS